MQPKELQKTKMIYIELAINAVFTGIGTAIGLTLNELFIKPRILEAHNTIKLLKSSKQRGRK